ncbi:uncharacterized protein Dwil_GK19130 [Drosophila willistoni]|uniref:tRNA (guanine(37)-N1)-methyltransferase n=1 Tax=Drosophila willistoni TaxID=7260 RepID=B4N3S3_DROWI|nr:uncharacterized protein Dwil_GK19130 [Drosophila willistoni]
MQLIKLISQLRVQQQQLRQILRQRHYFKNMECPELLPPANVRGMRHLQRGEFKKNVQVPRLRINESQVDHVMPLVKKFMLKMEKLKPVRPVAQQKEILLHPLPITKWESLPTEELAKRDITEQNFSFSQLELVYDNWTANEILKSILPLEEEGLTSYSRIGHIVHLNLRDHLLPFKSIIGQILLDKLPNCRSVVNKASTIDNTYRNFQMELICGQDDYQVETKENGIPFEFDFSQVYWNPRLSTEHERIVKLLQPGDVLYDVFAGVGPFSVPAAKKRCQVMANDLNPHSFQWLQHNAKRNKCLNNIQMFNKDGREFILKDLQRDLLERWHKSDSNYSIHITMNLPAMAVEFLDAFRALYNDKDLHDLSKDLLNYPTVHVYAFAKGENTKDLVKELVEQNLGCSLNAEENSLNISFVRNVAPKKDMYRVTFKLNYHLLTTTKETETTEPVVKKRKADDSDVALTKVKCI